MFLIFYTNHPTPLPCAILTIGSAARNSNHQGSRMQPYLSGQCMQP